MKASNVRYTTCEKEFVEKAIIKKGIRLDGRQSYDYRNIEIKFGKEYGSCEVVVGDTRVFAQTSCEIVKPLDSRPTDGQLYLNVDLSPMASPAFESGRMSIDGIEVNRLIERVLKESRPIDTESLCVLAGEKVWSVRVDILVLNNSGNILDCCCIAAVSSLAHFRRPDVTVSGHEITIHTFEEKQPVPLNVHHMPFCVTFGFIGNDGQQIIIDPEEKEESIISGTLMMAFNYHDELCCAQMSGGVCLDYEQLLLCANVAAIKATEITQILKEALEEDQVQRAPEPIQRREGLKTPAQPRDFITKTTAEPTENVHVTDKERDPVNLEVDKPSEVAAYLYEGTCSIGDSSTNAWMVSDNEDIGMDTDAVINQRRDNNTTCKETNVDNPIEIDDSEEEDVVIMDPGVITGKTCDDQNEKIRSQIVTKDNNETNQEIDCEEKATKRNKRTKKRKKKPINS